MADRFNSEWLTLPQIAKKAGLPESTVRRYAGTFGAFLKTWKAGGKTLYHEEVIQTLSGIAEMYRQGIGTEKILAGLRGTLPETMDMEEAPLARKEETGHQILALPLQQIAQAMTVLALDREEIKALIDKNRKQAEQIEALERRLEALEKKSRPSKGIFSWWRKGGAETRGQ